MIASLAIGGCATEIDTYVQGWPTLNVTMHEHATGAEIWSRCWSDLPLWQKLLGTIPIACTWVDLDRGTCDVYIADHTFEGTIHHELEHCKGGDHDGIAQAIFDRWKAKQQAHPDQAKEGHAPAPTMPSPTALRVTPQPTEAQN
ncbi:MAG: hypothetical protein PHY45_02840 [Rhodocyclaceae bacterium]|nr:hypothetical protein [Rhodocyclaceae bacterium]